MRKNLPVTQREFDLPADVTLMSTTDLAGKISYANAAFVAASGYDSTELLGQPHNLVRHPDMPAAAFADMWATLKAGHSWTGTVKNRRKNGDHYWVRANVTPVRRGQEITGYMSVRTKPSRSEVEAAEKLYRAFREGRVGRGIRLHQGLLVRSGALVWLSWHRTMPTRWRLRLAAFGLGAGAIGVTAVAGVTGLSLLLAAAAIAGLSLATAAVLEAQIARPLDGLLDQALRVAAGQPGDTAQLDRVDEVGMILRALNQSGLNLRSLVDDVSQQVDGVHTASREIAQGNSDLSRRTEQAAASLQQTAAAIDQIKSAITHSADRTREVASLTRDAARAAVQGGAVVAQVMVTMQELGASSRRIADITAIIDGIALRTNLLALNAAVEAARAGDHGRGFAVVADEVQGLARRTGEAAREIKALITEGVEQMGLGGQHVDEADREMNGVIERFHRVRDLIGSIDSAAAEQSCGIVQVNAAVVALDRATQQNAALVEQTAAAAEAMQHQAGRLAEAVAVFAR